MANDLLPLLIEAAAPAAEAKPWRVLVIDDDEQMHRVTRLALDGYRFKERPVCVVSAYSAAAARGIVDRDGDIALILLDVVMESEHAGLDVVDYVRVQRHNDRVRIVLRTGQPGQAPPLEVIQRYDIDDYRTKTELTFDRLYVAITAALRTYDLLERMAEHQRELAFLANHDALTGLPNRAMLGRDIARALAHARRSGRHVAVLFIDVDGFKFINDSYGHTLGDSLLRMLAVRLQESIREGDTVARIGGDEFVIVLDALAAPADAEVIANKMLSLLTLPLTVEGQSLLVTASIGISVCPRDGEDPETLLKNADVALYAAKQRGKNCAQAYRSGMSAAAAERVVLEHALRQALELGEFHVLYQPQLDLASGCISGVEALLRWTHPTLGPIAPQRFIRLAEELGLILPIGEWVLHTACEQLQRWHRNGHPLLSMAVNLSARQFHHHDVVPIVRAALQRSGISAHSLELELTETILISNPESVADTLQTLKELGVSISLDDFGTGYSSLSYLNRFPIDTIKIDQSFTARLHQGGDATLLVRAIIAMAHSLRLRTVSEGVETFEQARFMRDNGCDLIQGYYLGRPMPADSLSALLLNPGMGELTDDLSPLRSRQVG